MLLSKAFCPLLLTTLYQYHHRLYPGMRVVCLIRIGQRTVADYLLGYFLSPLGFGFREL